MYEKYLLTYDPNIISFNSICSLIVQIEYRHIKVFDGTIIFSSVRTKSNLMKYFVNNGLQNFSLSEINESTFDGAFSLDTWRYIKNYIW